MQDHGLSIMLPIIPHESAGVDCDGSIIIKVTGNDAELRCNECGAVVGVVQVGILRDFVLMIPDWMAPRVGWWGDASRISNYGAAAVAPVTSAPESALESHPCVALSSAQVTAF